MALRARSASHRARRDAARTSMRSAAARAPRPPRPSESQSPAHRTPHPRNRTSASVEAAASTLTRTALAARSRMSRQPRPSEGGGACAGGRYPSRRHVIEGGKGSRLHSRRPVRQRPSERASGGRPSAAIAASAAEIRTRPTPGNPFPFNSSKNLGLHWNILTRNPSRIPSGSGEGRTNAPGGNRTSHAPSPAHRSGEQLRPSRFAPDQQPARQRPSSPAARPTAADVTGCPPRLPRPPRRVRRIPPTPVRKRDPAARP